jgi:hypothetical protein
MEVSAHKKFFREEFVYTYIVLMVLPCQLLLSSAWYISIQLCGPVRVLWGHQVMNTVGYHTLSLHNLRTETELEDYPLDRPDYFYPGTKWVYFEISADRKASQETFLQK